MSKPNASGSGPGVVADRGRTPRKAAATTAADLPRRRALVIRTAEDAGLLEGGRERIAGRMRKGLIEAAKERSGISSDTELLEYALARVALEDRFAETLISLRGAVPPDLDLEFRS